MTPAEHLLESIERSIPVSVLRKQSLARLRELQSLDDVESAHLNADAVLCDLLKSLTFGDVVEEYQKLEKVYA